MPASGPGRGAAEQLVDLFLRRRPLQLEDAIGQADAFSTGTRTAWPFSLPLSSG